jgi:hypothetical protein
MTGSEIYALMIGLGIIATLTVMVWGLTRH